MGVDAVERSEFAARLMAAERRQEDLEQRVVSMRDSVEQLTAAVLRHVTRRQDCARSLDADYEAPRRRPGNNS